MSNIIEFPRVTKSAGDGEWMFNLSVYSHGEETSCFITEVAEQFDGMNRGASTRIMADRLDDLSFLMRQLAEKTDRTERGAAIMVVTLFEGGNVQLRTDTDRVSTEEQKSWVREQLDLAKTDKAISGGGTPGLPDDVAELVIAARNVAFCDCPSLEDLKSLDKASEAFADRVEWEGVA